MSRVGSMTIALLLMSNLGASFAAKEPTVPGPESKVLSNRATGYILHTPRKRPIVAVSLPDLNETVIRRDIPRNEVDNSTIHSLSGPDDEGRIAYIEDHFFVKNKSNERHLLKTIRIDGSGDTALFSRPGTALWAHKGEIGEQLALAPTGGKVAFLSGLSHKQMPQALFLEGTIELWDVGKKVRLPLDAKGVDQPMSWFPDGKQLAIVRFIARKDIPKKGVPVEQFGSGNYTGSWTELPAIYILDLQSGRSRFLSLGWIPVVSSDGKSVFVAGWVSARNGIELIWKRVDVGTGAVADVSWPGDAGGLIANPTDDLVLYWGLPTTGVPIKHSPYGSFRRGLMLVTIKAAIFNTGRFQTVIPEIDPRERVSFGRVLQK
jgi:hypothetical protein